LILDEIDQNKISHNKINNSYKHTNPTLVDSSIQQYIVKEQTLWTTIEQIVKDTQKSMPSHSSEQTTAFTNVLDIITNKINDVNTEQKEAEQLSAAEARLPITAAKLRMEAVALKIAQQNVLDTESDDDFNKWRSKGGGSQRRKPKTRRKKH
jgi:hypothetical protein